MTKTGHFYFEWSINGASVVNGAVKQAESLAVIEFAWIRSTDC
jgi:hypothetical protein